MTDVKSGICVLWIRVRDFALIFRGSVFPSPAVIPNGGEVVERLDVFDEATKRVGYTVIRGDPRFKHVSAVMHFVPGPTEGTTTATWTATYVPMNEHASLDNRFCIAVWKALESAAKA